MKGLNIIWVTFLLCSCAQRENVRIDRIIDSLVNSTSIEGGIMSVFERNMGTYSLYTISNSPGPIYDENGEVIISEIEKLKGKIILFYFQNKKTIKLKEKELIKLLQEDNANHKMLWYYATCKKRNKEILIQADNISVASYEIPQIRDFSCSTTNKVSPFEAIINYITIEMNDSSGIVRIYMIANLYDRNFETLHSRPDSVSFFFVNFGDTIQCQMEELSLYDMFIEDTLWVKNPALVSKYALNATINSQKSTNKPDNYKQMKNLLNKFMLSVYKLDSLSNVINDTIGVIIPQEININIKKN